MSALLAVWRLARFNTRGSMMIVALSVFGSHAPLLIGLLLREFYNALSGDARLDLGVWAVLGLFLTLSLALQALSITGSILIGPFGAGLHRAVLQRNLFRKILNSRPILGGPSAGDIINRFRDDPDGLAATTLRVLSLSGNVTSRITAVVVLVLIDPLLTLVAFVPALVSISVARILGKRIEAYHRGLRETTGRVTGNLGELLGATQALQIAGAELHSRPQAPAGHDL